MLLSMFEELFRAFLSNVMHSLKVVLSADLGQIQWSLLRALFALMSTGLALAEKLGLRRGDLSLLFLIHELFDVLFA